MCCFVVHPEKRVIATGYFYVVCDYALIARRARVACLHELIHHELVVYMVNVGTIESGLTVDHELTTKCIDKVAVLDAQFGQQISDSVLHAAFTHKIENARIHKINPAIIVHFDI